MENTINKTFFMAFLCEEVFYLAYFCGNIVAFVVIKTMSTMTSLRILK